MSQTAIIYPVLVQVLVTFVVLFWLARLRITALNSQVVRPDDIALGQPGWSGPTTQVGNSFRNQLELPMLFYVLVLLLLYTHLSDILQVVLAWVFVLSRIVHAYVHTTHNDVRTRGRIFGLGASILLVMWVVFAARFVMAAV